MGTLHKKKLVHKNRPTVGVLVDWTESDYHISILSGIYDMAVSKDINLICYEGGILNRSIETDMHDASRNIMYTFPDASMVDGLILFLGTMAHRMTDDQLKEFCDAYKPIPMVSVGRLVDSIPCVLIDNRHGLQEILYHLIEEHNYKRFVFIKGTEYDRDAKDRLLIFRETLTSRHIRIDESLILDGAYYSPTAERAVRMLIEGGKKNFDVIVSANDEMAFGALLALKSLGLHVPGDYAITGFDDLKSSGTMDPPLTTVRQPLREVGIAALSVLLEQIGGREVPLKTIVQTKSVIRQSCGCTFGYYIPCKKDKMTSPAIPLTTILAGQKTRIQTNIESHLQKLFLYRHEAMVQTKAVKLIEQFSEAIINEKPPVFLFFWDKFLGEAFLTTETFYTIESILNELFSVVLHSVPMNTASQWIYNIWQEALERIEKRSTQLEKQVAFEREQYNYALNDIRNSLVVTMEEDELIAILTNKLYFLKIAEFYLSLYHEGKTGPDGKSRLVLAYKDNKRIGLSPDEVTFPSRDLIPLKFYPHKRRFSYLLHCLNYTDHVFGFASFLLNPHQCKIFSNLRRIISNALYGSLIYMRSQVHKDKLEKQKMELQLHLEKFRKAMAAFINTLVKAIETRDPFTAGHQRRVADLARRIAQEMSLAPEVIETVRMASIIHDLGKIYIPADILSKPGKIKDIEFELIKTHPMMAYDIIKSIDFPWPIAEVVLQHHERLNGSGYPRGLKDKEINLPARIISVADVVEAMASRRPYREALGIDKALEEVFKNKGILYDPAAVDICLELFMKKNYTFIKETNT